MQCTFFGVCGARAGKSTFTIKEYIRRGVNIIGNFSTRSANARTSKKNYRGYLQSRRIYVQGVTRFFVFLYIIKFRTITNSFYRVIISFPKKKKKIYYFSNCTFLQFCIIFHREYTHIYTSTYVLETY